MGMRKGREEEERDEREMFYPRWLSICRRDPVRDQVLFRLGGWIKIPCCPNTDSFIKWWRNAEDE